MAALLLAGLVVVWHLYILGASGSPAHWRSTDAVWAVGYDYRLVPASIGLAMATVGIVRRGRWRWLNGLSIAVILAACVLLSPPTNFA